LYFSLPLFCGDFPARRIMQRIERYMLWLGVCLSFSSVSKLLNGSNWFSARRLRSSCATTNFKYIHISPKIKALLSETLFQIPYSDFLLFRRGTSINQSVKIYFPSNNRKLQCNKCNGTRKATRKVVRWLKLVAWQTKQHKYECICMASVLSTYLNLVRLWQVYHTERPPLFTTHWTDAEHRAVYQRQLRFVGRPFLVLWLKTRIVKLANILAYLPWNS